MMRAVFLSFWILLIAANMACAQESNPLADKKVLILHSQHETFHWTDKLNHAIKEEFASAPFGIHLYVEYMDARRFPAEDLFPQLRELYQIKYHHLKFDLILITDNAAFDFLIAYRNELFPQVPVAFCGLNNYTPAMVDAYKGITGILEDFDLKGTIELVLTVQPEIRTIAMVSDASDTGRLHRRRFLDLKPLFENRVALLDFANLDEQLVVRQIRNMPDESSVIVLSYHLDPHGKFFSVREGMKVLQKGGRPLYSCWETSLGQGIVGGVITNAWRHGRDAARMGIDVLKGKKTADIPVQSCVNLPMFDYPYLEMFKINQALLPNNSIIINKPDSFYIRHRKMIISVSSVFVVMSCLIVGLIINIIRRQQAQRQLIHERNFTETVLNTAEALVVVINPAGEILIFNRACRKCTGYTIEEIQRVHFWDILSLPEDREPIHEMIKNAKDEFPREFEKYLITKDGRRRLIRWFTSVVLNRYGVVDFIIGTGIDITERKQAEEALKKSEELLNVSQHLAKVGGWEYDVQSGKASWSEELYRLHEIPNDPAIDHIQESLNCYRPEDKQIISEAFKDACEKGEPYDLEFPFTTYGGKRLWIRTAAKPVYDKGKVVRVIGNLTDITDRKQNEAVNAMRLHLIHFSLTHSVDELLEETLNGTEELTDSRIGFCHFVEEDQETLSLQNWSTRTKAIFCKAEGKGLHYPIEQTGVWVDCVHQRKTVIHNDYASLAHRKGITEGHTAVIRELVVPVFRGEKIVAIMGVGNKPVDYTEKDVEIVSLIADLAWEITERRRAEEVLENTAMRLNKAQRLAQIGSWELDLTTDVLTWTDEIFRIFEFDPDKFGATYEAFLNAIHPDDREAVNYAYTYSLENRTPYSIDHRLRMPDGRIKYVHEQCETFYDTNGNPMRSVGTSQDITKRKQTEQEVTWNLAVNQALSSLYIPIVAAGTNIQQIATIVLDRCRQLTSSAHGFVAEIDPVNGDLTAHTLTNMMQTECLVVEEKLRKIVFPQRADGLYNGLWGHALNTKEPFYTNDSMQHPASAGVPEGHIVIEKFLTVPVLLIGELVGLIAVSNPSRPYTDRDLDAVKRIAEFYALAIQHKRTEEEIQTLNQELEERVASRTAQLEAANRELEAFAYSVSHDLRAPLRHIDGFLSLLEKKNVAVLDHQSRHYMDTISDASKKMGLLIDHLLSFSRMGRQAMSLQQVALGDLVVDVMHEFELDSAGRNIDWRIGELPTVEGDASMLKLVLVNLIANALKFTRPRQQARIEIGSQPGPNAEVVIFVRDNGVGFEMTYGDRLFGVFQRLHRAEEFEGTGIGLANVRRIIARHGGRTWAQGELGQGAAFFFSLPQTPIGDGHVHH